MERRPRHTKDVAGPSERLERPGGSPDILRLESKKGRINNRIKRELFRTASDIPLSQEEKPLFDQYKKTRMSMAHGYREGRDEGLRRYQNIEEKMTEDERWSVKEYTLGDYVFINTFARCDVETMKGMIEGGRPFEEVFNPRMGQISDTEKVARMLIDDPELFETTKEHCQNLDRVTGENHIPEAVVVRKDLKVERLLPFLCDAYGQPQETIQAGHFWIDPGFVSTSLDHGLTQKSLYGPDADIVQMYISLPEQSPGAYISSIAYKRNEEELLLPREPRIRLDHVVYFDKSNLDPGEKRRLEYLPSYVIQASSV